MKKIVLGLLLIVLVSCSPKCSIKNIDIKGEWEVYKTEFIDKENKMKDVFESQGGNFDETIKQFKLFEEVKFHFKKNGKLDVSSPEEIGGDTETIYSYGNDNLIIGDKQYAFEVKSCDEITISDVLIPSVKFVMYCKRR